MKLINGIIEASLKQSGYVIASDHRAKHKRNGTFLFKCACCKMWVQVLDDRGWNECLPCFHKSEKTGKKNYGQLVKTLTGHSLQVLEEGEVPKKVAEHHIQCFNAAMEVLFGKLKISEAMKEFGVSKKSLIEHVRWVWDKSDSKVVRLSLELIKGMEKFKAMPIIPASIEEGLRKHMIKTGFASADNGKIRDVNEDGKQAQAQRSPRKRKKMP